jgi:hypothetical protein
VGALDRRHVDIGRDLKLIETDGRRCVAAVRTVGPVDADVAARSERAAGEQAKRTS